MKTRTKPQNAFTIHTLKWQDRNYLLFASFFKIGACIFITSAMGILFIFGYNYLTQCHYFKTPKVAISGTQLLSPSLILDIAQLNTNVNVLAVNLKRTRKLILSNPWIDEVTITRQIPSMLKIHITEHKPLAILELAISGQSNRYIINERGKIFKKWSSAKIGLTDTPRQLSDKTIVTELPIIKGLDYSDLDVSGQPSGVQFNTVMKMLRLGQEADALIPNRDIKKILLDKEVGLTFYTNTRPFFKGKPKIGMLNKDSDKAADIKINAVRIGYEDYTAKLARLRQLIYHLGRNYDVVEFDLIDMANLSRITAKPIYIKARTGEHNET